MGRESNKKRRQANAATAREKAAAARALQARAEQKRRATIIISVIAVIAVIGAVIAIVAVNHKGTTTSIADNRALAPANVINPVTSVPVATLDAVGQGTVISSPQPASTVKNVKTEPTLMSNGKPELLYIGAEFCPYCAAERWAMGVALSRFGTLSGVRVTTSSSTDTDPNTQTLDFIGSKYTSQYLSFTPVENEDRAGKPLQKLTSAQNALWNNYTNNSPGFPFLDFGNKYIVSGPTYDPKVLAGLSRAQIASKLANASDPVAKAVDGAANLLTAAICGMTNNQPASVCSSKTITTLKAEIDAQGASTTPSPGSSVQSTPSS